MTGLFGQEKNLLDMFQKAKFSRKKVQKISRLFYPLRFDWSSSVYPDFVYGSREFQVIYCLFQKFFDFKKLKIK